MHKFFLMSKDATVLPLVWQGVTVENVQLQTERQGTPANVFSTFRMRSHADLSRGTDFLRTQATLGPVFVRFVHLNHDPYTFNITVRVPLIKIELPNDF
jgi:hypothetical protein